DEVGEVAAAFNEFIYKLHHLMQEIHQSAYAVQTVSEELNDHTRTASGQMQSQCLETHTVVTALTVICMTAEEVKRNKNN
ncbi:methyl-accepting chemotaxis protein, partial [Vibrio parahaemolyticus]|nr:methyl-accepting chemotaxis protein [Vibrio parahaemolyticus]